MATIRTLLPLLLFALAIMGGELVERVKGDSTFMRRREAIEAWAAPGPAPSATCTANYCPTAKLPDCCQIPGGTLLCTNLQTDYENCGGCSNLCSVTVTCCGGECVELDDPKNCGSCGNVCGAGCTCVDGKCTS